MPLALVTALAAVVAAVLSSGCGRTKPHGDRPDGAPQEDTAADASDVGDVSFDAAPETLDASGEAGDGPAEGPASTGSILGTSVAVRPSGNIVVAGGLTGTVDLGAGALVSAGGTDIVVAELSPMGAVIWNRRFGDERSQSGALVALDGTGNTFLATLFEGALSLGGDPLVSAGTSDLGVVKLDAAGNHVWSRRLGNPNTQLAVGLAADGSGGVTAAMELGSTPNGGSSIVRLSPSGDVAWTKSFNGAFVWDMASVASGGVVATGSLWGTVDFGGGPLVSAGVDDVFVVELAPTGDWTWSKRFGGYGSDHGRGIAVDPTGALLLTGLFNDTLDFGGGAPLVSVRDQGRFAPSFDIYVAKLDARGAHVWSRSFGDTTSDQSATDVAATASGGAVVTGVVGTSTDFGLGPLKATDGLVFVLGLGGDGHALWNGQLPAGGGAVAVAPSGKAFVTGSFPATPPGAPASRTFRAGGGVFLVEYPP